MRCALGPEPKGAAAAMPGRSCWGRSAVPALPDSRLSVRSGGDRRAGGGVAGARRGARSPRRCGRCRGAATAGGAAPGSAARGLAENPRDRRRDAPDPHGLGQRLHCRRQARGCDPSQRIHADARILRVEPAGHLFRVEPGLGARLGRGCGARRQARRPRPAGYRDLGRRLAFVRQPGGGASRRGGARPAGACS